MDVEVHIYTQIYRDPTEKTVMTPQGLFELILG